MFWKKKKSGTLRAMEWLKTHTVSGEGVIVHTKLPQAYPEVTGYFVPTLYQWGEKDLAHSFTRWLISIQLDDGAFPAPDGTPYTFDTGQIMRGLLAAVDDVEGARESLGRAADWMLTQVSEEGRLLTPSTELWDDIANDMIHVYTLYPLKRAGEVLQELKYIEAAHRVLDFYKSQAELVPFNRLAHFHAYIMEALWEMGEEELARQGMAQVAALQGRNGSIPAYPDVDWICSTAIAQYAVVWYRLGEKERADRGLKYLERIQNPSGGWFGSYGKGAKYIAGAEISWAVKYFLDAHYLKQQGEVGHA